MNSLIKNDITRARKFHGCSRFIDDLCSLNDSGEFGRSYCDIYPSELELKCEHQGTHATFLDLDITIDDGTFIYKLFDKRDSFPFDIVRMPHKDSNIPSSIFYSTILSEYLRIARSTLLFVDFLPRVISLAKRMINQGGDCHKIIRQFNKALFRHPDSFKKFSICSSKMIDTIKQNIIMRCGGT